ncbi:unnamed protein product [Porites evermanni]|uniref:N-alpha-acetyltransferase 40 n=1 Tax=Porites evermanni TaxID=104178 RepID=A0ABN8M3A3_9CNID|nr:unnamed protein product [Porites evermanni]
MGKKSAKGKEKKLKRKEEMAKVSAAQAVVDVANEVEDPLAPLTAFKSFNRNGLNVHLECQRVTNMSKEDIDWAFDLTKHNMQLLYENSSWGWSDKKKRDEMTEDKAWYLVAKCESGKAIGFSHFRFDLDEGDEVLYCYEIQLESNVRGKGLGKFLMQILEMMAHRAQMKKVMLTVFKDCFHMFPQNLPADDLPKHGALAYSPTPPTVLSAFCGAKLRPYGTSWNRIYADSRAQSKVVVDLTKQIFTGQGISRTVRSEDGPHFHGYYRQFAKEYRLIHVTSSLNYPKKHYYDLHTKASPKSRTRFQTDETSPAIWDPMNPEDYCYDILSKTLIRKTSATTTTEGTSI